MAKKYLKLSDIGAYKKSFRLSNVVWELVTKWDKLSKWTVGEQLIRSVDSISANIAEGFGRYHKKDKQKFYYNARASVFESLDWLQKAKVRKIVTNKVYKSIYEELNDLPKEINSLISFTEDKLNK